MPTNETLGERAVRALRRACATFDFGNAEKPAIELLRLGASSWFDWPCDRRFPVFLLADTPFELCVQLPPHDTKLLRFTFEPISDKTTLLSYWDSASASLERMCKHLGFRFDMMRKIYDLARPSTDSEVGPRHWASWIGAALTPAGQVTLKTYICMQHAQDQNADIDEILATAGVSPAARAALTPDVLRRIGMLTVDLSAEGVKRVKAYLVLAPTGPKLPDDMDRLGAMTKEYVPGDGRRFLERYAPNALENTNDGPFVTCTLHAVEDRWDRLTLTVLYFEHNTRPKTPELVRRTRALIREYGADEATYDRFASVVGEENVTVASLQRQKGVPMITLYGGVTLFDGATP